jgi:hypothetical protein
MFSRQMGDVPRQTGDVPHSRGDVPQQTGDVPQQPIPVHSRLTRYLAQALLPAYKASLQGAVAGPESEAGRPDGPHPRRGKHRATGEDSSISLAHGSLRGFDADPARIRLHCRADAGSRSKAALASRYRGETISVSGGVLTAPSPLRPQQPVVHAVVPSPGEKAFSNMRRPLSHVNQGSSGLYQ